jgi:hypothetical protein
MAAETKKPSAQPRSGTRGRASMIVVFILGISGSFFFSRPLLDQAETQWAAQADAAATQLASTFMLLLDHSNGPLQSLATLFNGSGRVAADEFENTITYLKGHRSGAFPESMGFFTKSQPSSCGNDDGCWMVAYSTDVSGVLRPGADVSRFGPMVATIDAALATENSLIIGPVFQRESGRQYSYYAVTIRNTRQFGVVVSLIDYENLVERMYEEWVPEGMSLRLQASFRDGDSMSEPRFIIGGSDPAERTLRSISVPAESDGAQFTLIWDVTEDYAGGPKTRAGNYALYTGIFATLFLMLLIRARHTRRV